MQARIFEFGLQHSTRRLRDLHLAMIGRHFAGAVPVSCDRFLPTTDVPISLSWDRSPPLMAGPYEWLRQGTAPGSVKLAHVIADLWVRSTKSDCVESKT